jgi:hypothetical protein
MPWVALEHDFTANPKVVQLTAEEFRSWVSLLCWAARFRTRGFIPKTIGVELAGATVKRTKKYELLGLLETRPDGWYIHDWDEYNGTGKEREQARLRKQAQRERSRQDRDNHRDNVTPAKRDNVTPASRARPAARDDAPASQDPGFTSLPTVPLPHTEEPLPPADTSEHDDIAFDPPPARNGTPRGRMTEADIPATIGQAAAAELERLQRGAA